MASWLWPHHPRPSPCLLSVSLDLGLPWITQGELIATPLDRAYFPARSCPQIPGRRMRHILLGATSPPPTDGNREQQPFCMAPGGGSVHFSSVALLLLTLCNHMDCSTPGPMSRERSGPRTHGSRLTCSAPVTICVVAPVTNPVTVRAPQNCALASQLLRKSALKK